MCGIAGILSLAPDGASSRGNDRALEGMLGRQVHRGPDGTGWTEAGACALGINRLAIIDPGAPARPSTSEDGRVIAVTNGQVYNHRELRRELEASGHSFRTGVDTEVIPHLWEERGPDLVHRLNGMFALAVWDRRSRTLLLARDRAGEKPLFYCVRGGKLLFASELRALLAHPEVTPRLDPEALSRYLVHGYIPAPLSPLEGIRKLPAGHRLVARAGRGESSLEVVRYWGLEDWLPRPGEPASGSAKTLAAGAAALDEHLRSAVTRRLQSDVPLGVFLSGGLDSATVLSYAAEALGPGVPAFTVGHRDRGFDESDAAAHTARALEADLHRLVLGEEELGEGLLRVGAAMDEPLGDASTLPTHLLARFARERVRVVLSGEGADELFAGYPTYLGHRVADGLDRLPGWAQRPLQGALQGGIRSLAPASMGNVGIDYLLRRFASGLGRGRLERHQLWFGAIAPGRLPELLSPELAAALGEAGTSGLLRGAGSASPSLPAADPLAQLLHADFTGYLQDDLLTKVDRCTMLASLEARAPFLDHELVQHVAGLPSRWKLRGGTTKAILRRAVRDRLPAEVLQRKKRGFNIPFSRWVLHGLGPVLQDRFSRERVEARGLFEPTGVQALLSEHLARREDHRKPLFALLAFDLWCDRTFGEGAAVPWGTPGEIEGETEGVTGGVIDRETRREDAA